MVPLLFLSPERNYAGLIDWRAIFAMSGLLVISAGLEHSGYFDALLERHASRFSDERRMAFFFIILSFALSTFLTNDITLFIIVPLTLAFGRGMGADTGKLIVFEAIAVNSGSALSPIGNPQNIYLWSMSGLSSISFFLAMLPLGALLFLSLLLFTHLSFKSRELAPAGVERKQVNRYLLLLSAILLPLFIVAVEMNILYIALPLILIAYLPWASVLKRADWAMILLFVVMFLDFGLLASMPSMSQLSDALSSSPMLSSAVLSQFISNVPAAIFVSSFSSDWKAIAYGVNVAGNGLVIASMANIIAIRLSKRPLLKEFHRYSIPFFLFTFTLLLAAKIF